METADHSAAFGVAVEPPCLEPTSGMYCPPILVTLTHPLGRIDGTLSVDDDGEAMQAKGSIEVGGRELTLQVFYTIQHAKTANQLQGANSTQPPSKRHRYTGPFSLKAVGRVKITAYAVLGAPGVGLIQSQTSTALYVLDQGAPPPVSISTGSVFHKTPIALPSVKAVPVQREVKNETTGEKYTVLSSAPTHHRPGASVKSQGATSILEPTATTIQPSSGQEDDGAVYSSPRHRLLMEKSRLLDGGASGENDQLPHHDLLMLKFVDFPEKVHCYQPFDLQVYLVDPFGYPVSAPGVAGTKMALSADMVGDGRATTAAAPGQHSSGASPIVVASVDAEGLHEPTQTPPPWAVVHNVICSNEQTALQRSYTGRGTRGGGTGLDHNKWDAVAGVNSIVGVQGAHVGYTFTINSLCRAIVGLYDDEALDPNFTPPLSEDPLFNHRLEVGAVAGKRQANVSGRTKKADEAETTVCRDPVDERSWRQLQYSIHFSADLADPTLLPAFRIYEKGCLVKSVDTRDFHVGDTFSLKIRPNGRVAYFHNGDVVYTSAVLAQQVNRIGQLGLQVRIAAQHSCPAITNGYLLDQEAPTLFKLKGVVWHPATKVPAQGSNPTVTERQGVLRAWIVGKDFVPAVMRVPVVIAPIPRWGIAGFSLASMFALGGMGLQGNTMAHALQNNQDKVPQLSLIRGHRKPPPATQGLQHSRVTHVFGPDDEGIVQLGQEIPVSSPTIIRYPENPELSRPNRYGLVVPAERPQPPQRGGSPESTVIGSATAIPTTQLVRSPRGDLQIAAPSNLTAGHLPGSARNEAAVSPLGSPRGVNEGAQMPLQDRAYSPDPVPLQVGTGGGQSQVFSTGGHTAAVAGMSQVDIARKKLGLDRQKDYFASERETSQQLGSHHSPVRPKIDYLGGPPQQENLSSVEYSYDQPTNATQQGSPRVPPQQYHSSRLEYSEFDGGSTPYHQPQPSLGNPPAGGHGQGSYLLSDYIQ